MNYLGEGGVIIFLLYIKYKLLFMWGLALGCYIFCYCLFLPPKTLRIPLPHVLFTSFCGFVLYQLEWVGEAQFYGFLIEKQRIAHLKMLH